MTRADGRLPRRGASTLGCLFTLLVTSVAIYFAVNAFEVYWKNVEFSDEMRSQVRFASHYTNDQIIRRLRLVADSLDLPEDAHRIYVTRGPTTIKIEAEYDGFIELPFYVRPWHFNPRAEGAY